MRHGRWSQMLNSVGSIVIMLINKEITPVLEGPRRVDRSTLFASGMTNL
jgi:hypothetical protein